ncbi:hypothetical protein DDV82_09250 [Campylobacter jejuni]|nr:hypothetical protein DDV82_09250 [Campylobacter jejuni]
MPRKCSFCNEVENPQRRILANENDDAFICEYCFEGAYSIIYGKEKEFTANTWPAIFRSMADRTGIDKKDRWLV